jgi:hypothetical protein
MKIPFSLQRSGRERVHGITFLRADRTGGQQRHSRPDRGHGTLSAPRSSRLKQHRSSEDRRLKLTDGEYLKRFGFGEKQV